MPARLGVARFKLVISATREGIELYPSVEDLPGDRQRMARQALDGELATTLLIADKAGLQRMRSLITHPEGERNSACRAHERGASSRPWLPRLWFHPTGAVAVGLAALILCRLSPERGESHCQGREQYAGQESVQRVTQPFGSSAPVELGLPESRMVQIPHLSPIYLTV